MFSFKDLRAGEVLFVPAGSPHTVINLEDSIAVSGTIIILYKILKPSLKARYACIVKFCCLFSQTLFSCPFLPENIKQLFFSLR